MMPKIIILGNSDAISDEQHANTHFAVVGKERLVLVDCADNPIPRLKHAGLAYQDLTDLVLTHFHPDHAAGAPTLVINLWLLGRKSPLHVHGLEYTLERFSTNMALYGWDTWPNMYPVEMHPLPEKELTVVLECNDLRIRSSPVCHLVPTIGLRIESPGDRKVAAYSCDSEPCQEVVELARGADILLHEASGTYPGHATAYQAGEIAHQAGVKSLYLIHYPVGEYNPQVLISQARQAFDGQVRLAEGGMILEL